RLVDAIDDALLPERKRSAEKRAGIMGAILAARAPWQDGGAAAGGWGASMGGQPLFATVAIGVVVVDIAVSAWWFVPTTGSNETTPVDAVPVSAAATASPPAFSDEATAGNSSASTAVAAASPTAPISRWSDKPLAPSGATSLHGQVIDGQGNGAA